MAIITALTKTDSFKTYTEIVGANSGVALDNLFAAGLPSVWLYMKALGLETEFFNLLQQAEKHPSLYKELMYLLYLTHANSNYFPAVPTGLLKLEIPGLVEAAQVEISNPDFKLVFELSRERLTELLKELAVNNRLIRIGTKSHTVGVTFRNDVYSVYHSGNTKALEYTKLNDCVDAILNMQPNTKNHEHAMVVLETFNLAGMPVPKPPIALEYFAKFAKTYNEEQMQECIYTCVLAQDITALQYLQKNGADFTFKKFGIDLLRLAVVQDKPNRAIIELLIKNGVERRVAIEEIISLKAKHPENKQLDETLRLLHADPKSTPLLHSVGAPSHKAPTKPSSKN